MYDYITITISGEDRTYKNVTQISENTFKVDDFILYLELSSHEVLMSNILRSHGLLTREYIEVSIEGNPAYISFIENNLVEDHSIPLVKNMGYWVNSFQGLIRDIRILESLDMLLTESFHICLVDDIMRYYGFGFDTDRVPTTLKDITVLPMAKTITLICRIFKKILNEKTYTIFTLSENLYFKFFPKQEILSPSALLDYIGNIKRITGPTAFTLINTNNKLVFLFGDDHISTERECEFSSHVQLLDFFNTFFLNSPVCCDFFVEFYKFMNFKENTVSLIDQENSLKRVIKEYSSCSSREKKNCDRFGNVRIHDINFRRFGNSMYDVVNSPIWTNSEKFIDKLYLYKDILKALVYSDMKLASELFLKLFEDSPLPIYDFYNEETFIKSSGFDKISKQYRNTSIDTKNKALLYYDILIGEVFNATL